MDIKFYIQQYDIPFDKLKADYKADFDSLFEKEKVWLGNLEDKTHLLKNDDNEKVIKVVIEKLKSGQDFKESDTESLSIFTSQINLIVSIANRINNFKEGTAINGSELKLIDLFNAIKNSTDFRSFKFSLNQNLDNFLPHLYSVIKHCQDPNEYPIYYKYWKNIMREVLTKEDDYDEMSSFYRTFPTPNRHLNFATYFGTIGIQIAKNISTSGIDLNKESKDYKYLTKKVINVERYRSILDEHLENDSHYYLVGAYWDGSNPADQTQRFIENGIWENGYDDKFIDDVISVTEGSKIAIKAAYTREKTKSVMAIKARGIVTKNYTDGKRLEINWEQDFDPFEVDFSGGYWATIKEVTNQDHINSIWFPDQNNNSSMNSKKMSDMNFPLNTILYGPPGTGKTYNTILRAAEIIKDQKISSYDEALTIFRSNLHDQIEFITFHQNYSYEDFIQGLRPETDNKSSLLFEKKDGVFKKIADKALENLRLSEKAPDELSSEALFDRALEIFSEKVLESEENYKINDTAYIFEIEEDAFRYTGDKWTNHTNGLRMKFTDLKEFYRNDVKSRKDVKKLTTISGLANQHATYYFLVYSHVLDCLPDNVEQPQSVVRKNFVLIIDEINRANISRVFGELITLIEPDKRSHGTIPMETKLPSGDIFKVPSNLYIVGTMNTADKSIALLDIALRRRFEFESMYPKYDIDGQEIYDVEILKKINQQIIKSKGHDFQIGHAYFMGENKDLVQRMNKNVIPLLLEYYMNDEKEVRGILQSAGLTIEDDSWPIRISGLSD